MDDLDLDRELRAAFDVAPSPEFVARVRAAIAERRPGRLPSGWLVVTGAVCVVTALTLVSMPGADAPDSIRNRVSPTPPRSAALAPASRAETVATNPPAVADASSRRRRARSAVPGEAPAVPEVLVSEADKRAFEEFVAAVHQDRFAATFEEAPASTPYVVTDLAIPPIAIEPLAASASTDGAATVHN